MKFVIIDIKDFYPSVTQDLLNKALNFASEYIYILKCDVIHYARKSLVFDGSDTWIKKQKKVCLMCQWVLMTELVGTYMLNLLTKKPQQKRFWALP